MKQYDNLFLKLDADFISLLFTPDGDLGSVEHGRDSVKNFSSSFKKFKSNRAVKHNLHRNIKRWRYNKATIIKLI